MANKRQIEKAVNARRIATGRPMTEAALLRVSKANIRLRPREEMRLVARPTSEEYAKAQEAGLNYVPSEIHTLNFYNIDGEAVLASVYGHILFYGRSETPEETERELVYTAFGEHEKPMGRKAYERGLALVKELQDALDEAGMGAYPSEVEAQVAKLDADINRSNVASAKVVEARRTILDLSTEFVGYDLREELAGALEDVEAGLQDCRASAHSRIAASASASSAKANARGSVAERSD